MFADFTTLLCHFWPTLRLKEMTCKKVSSQRLITVTLYQHNNSVLIKYIVSGHLAPKVTVGNHLHIEHHWLGRNTEQPTAGSVLARQTHSHQTHSQRHSTRYRDVKREEKKQREKWRGSDRDALIQSNPQSGSPGINNQSEMDRCLSQSEHIPMRILSRPNQLTPGGMQKK